VAWEKPCPCEGTLVGFHKKVADCEHHLPESVEEALCFGWIDGVRRSLDEIATDSFYPRKPQARGAINIKLVEKLIGEGRMRPSVWRRSRHAREQVGSLLL